MAIFTFLFFLYEVWNTECGSDLKFDVSMDLKMIEASSICVNPKQTTLTVTKSGTRASKIHFGLPTFVYLLIRTYASPN